MHKNIDQPRKFTYSASFCDLNFVATGRNYLCDLFQRPKDAGGARPRPTAYAVGTV